MTNITQKALTNYLGRLESIGAFRTTLEAFGFEDWKVVSRQEHVRKNHQYGL